jgi:hypothetical protein
MTSKFLYPSPSPKEAFHYANEIKDGLDFVLPSSVETSTTWQNHQLDSITAAASAPLPINDVEDEEGMLILQPLFITHYVVVLQEQSKCLLCPLAMVCFLVALLTYSVVRKTAPASQSNERAPASKGGSPAGEKSTGEKSTGEKSTGEKSTGEKSFAHTITV